MWFWAEPASAFPQIRVVRGSPPSSNFGLRFSGPPSSTLGGSCTELAHPSLAANRFFANVSDERFGELLVRLPDDAQLADDPLHNNPGEARFVPALLFLTRYMRASWYLLGDDDSFFFLGPGLLFACTRCMSRP